MKRRDFLKAITASIIGAGLPNDLLASMIYPACFTHQGKPDDPIKDYLHKMKHFNRPHRDDIYLDRDGLCLLECSVKRLKRLQSTIGHGNFHLLSFDHAIRFAKSYSRVGGFAREELEFLEMIFYDDSRQFGFMGEKPEKELTAVIPKREVIKVPGTGNYLYKGTALETYERIKKDLGNQVILTSGIRSVIKQFLLFLSKAYRNDGNLSLASRSLAPPGYSYHSVGDFDVGQIGLGGSNFTERFTTTEVYRKLRENGYLKLRYYRENLLGVRFEPWHIRII